MRKSILGFFALVSVLFLTLNGAIAAPEPSLVCVQNQAQHLGIKTGTIDGLMGRKTSNASHQLAETYPSLKSLHPLTRDSAIVWCREIGELDKTQAQYWPTKTTPKFDFLLSDSLNNRQQRNIQNAVAFANRFFSAYDIHLAGPIKIIASPNEAELATKLMANSRYPMRRSTAHQIVHDQCRGQYLSGFNTAGIVVVCIGANFDWSDSYLDLRELLTHEISHEIHRQYAGYMPAKKINDKKTILQRRGPRWLAEASAIAFQIKAILPYVEASELIQQLSQSERRFSGQKLRQLVYIEATFKDHFTNYATLAGQMLVNRKDGYEGYFTYWRLLARMNWQAAFTQAFGLTPEAFYTEFDHISAKTTGTKSLISSHVIANEKTP